MKKNKLLPIFLSTFLILSGCSNNNNTAKEDISDSIMYSNINNDSMKNEITELLKENGITEEQINQFFRWSDDFNSRVTNVKLIDGYTIENPNKKLYKELLVKEVEGKNGEVVPEVNCRLCSYLLLKNSVETNKKRIINDTFIMFDEDAINNYEKFKMSPEEKSNYLTLFNWIPMNGEKDFNKQVELLKKAWMDRGIKLNNNKIALINLYMHSPMEDVRFVGHTGILIKNDNRLVFIEKYGPLYPFQITKFNSKDELKKYLLSRPDIIGDGTELEPIVMENDQVL